MPKRQIARYKNFRLRSIAVLASMRRQHLMTFKKVKTSKASCTASASNNSMSLTLQISYFRTVIVTVLTGGPNIS